MSEHLVSEALYLRDPDGHGIEIYRDRPRDEWYDAEGKLALTTLPLDVDNLVSSLGNDDPYPFELMPPRTRMGHVHLSVVRRRPRARRSTHGVLGFEEMARLGDQATFLGAGGYHHHLGGNVWNSRGAALAGPGTARLQRFTVELPDVASRDAAAARVADAGGEPCRRGRRRGGGRPLRDRVGARGVARPGRGESCGVRVVFRAPGDATVAPMGGTFQRCGPTGARRLEARCRSARSAAAPGGDVGAASWCRPVTEAAPELDRRGPYPPRAPWRLCARTRPAHRPRPPHGRGPRRRPQSLPLARRRRLRALPHRASAHDVDVTTPTWRRSRSGLTLHTRKLERPRSPSATASRSPAQNARCSTSPPRSRPPAPPRRPRSRGPAHHTHAKLVAFLDSHARCPGAPALRRHLDTGPAPTRSELEDRLLELLHDFPHHATQRARRGLRGRRPLPG